MMLMVKKSKRNTLTLGWNWHQKRSQKESKAKDRALKTLLWIVKDAEGWDPVAKWLECCVEEVKYAEMRELQRQIGECYKTLLWLSSTLDEQPKAD